MVTLYEIETERLLLRQWREGDWVGLHRAYGDSEVMSWIGAGPADLAATAAAVGRMSMHWLLLGYGMFAVEQRTSGEIVGRVGLMQHPDWPSRDRRSRSAGRSTARSASDLQHDPAGQRPVPRGDGAMRLDAAWRAGFPWLATGPLCDRSAGLAAS